MSEFEKLVAELQESVSDPAKKQLAAAVAADLVRAASLSLSDPERAAELVTALKAQTAALAAAEASQWTSIATGWVTRIAGAVIAGALA